MTTPFPVRISDLPGVSLLQDNDLLLTVDKSDITLSPSGTTKKTSALALKNYVFSGFQIGPLNSHSDVNISSPQNTQILRYNAETSKWSNWTPNYLTASGFQSISIGSFLDVDLTTPPEHSDALLWDGNDSAFKGTNLIEALNLARTVGAISDLQTASKFGGVVVKQYYESYSEDDLADTTEKNGGGIFYWDASIPKSFHNGGIYVSPTVPYNGTREGLVDFLNQVGETDPNGFGCWVRIYYGNVLADYFGCVGNGIADDQPSIQKALDFVFDISSVERVGPGLMGKTNVVEINGTCRIKKYIEIGGRMVLYGQKNTLAYPQQDSSYASTYNYMSGPIIYVDADCELYRPTTYNSAVVLKGDSAMLEGIVVDGYEMTYGSWYPIIKIATSPAGVGGTYAFNGEFYIIDPDDPKQKKSLTLETMAIPSHQYGDEWYPGYQLKAMGGNVTGVGSATDTYTDISPSNPYQWDVINGTIPTGFAISKSGWVTCDPEIAEIGKQFVTIRVADADGNTAQEDLVLEVTGKYIELPLSSVPPATINQSYKYTWNILNDDGEPHYWWLVNGPEGLVMNRSTGEITGTPPANAFGKYKIKIAITDTISTTNFEANTLIDEVTIDFTVENTSYPKLYGSLPEARLGVPYEGILYPYGGVGPFTWEIDVEKSIGNGNNQPGYPTTTQPAPGLTLSTDGVRGYITGTPTTSGNFTFYVKFTDSTGKSGGALMGFSGTSWIERPEMKTSLIWNLPVAVKGQPYSYQIEATVPGCTFSAKSLPSGLTMTPEGLISGTPVGGKYANGIACEWGAKLHNFTVRNFKGGAGVIVDGPSNVHIFRDFFINSCDVGIQSDNMYDSRLDSFYIYNTRIGLQMRGGTAANTYSNGRIEYIHEHGVTALFSSDTIFSDVYWDTCGYTGIAATSCDYWTISNCFFFRGGRRVPPRGKYYMPDSPIDISTHIKTSLCNNWEIVGNVFARGCDTAGSSATYLRRYESKGKRSYIRPYTCIALENSKRFVINGNGLQGCTRASLYSREIDFEFDGNEAFMSGNVVQVENQFSILEQDANETKNLLNNADKSNFVSEGTEDNVDPYFPNVSLLLHGHELVDRSPRAYTIGATAVTINNSIFKVGTGSLEFNGTSSFLYPQVADNTSSTAGFYFATGPLSIELLCYPTRNNVVQTLMDFGSTSESAPFALILDANGKLAIAKNRSTGGQTIEFTSTRTIPINAWSKIVMTRTSGVVRIYIDDTLEATLSTEFSNRFIISGYYRPTIGRGGYSGATDFFQGYMQEIRITKDISRYTVLTTLPTQTRPFGDVNMGSLSPDTLIFSPASVEKEHFWADRSNSVKLAASASITKPLKVIRKSKNDMTVELRAGKGSYVGGDKNPSYYYYNFTKEAETGITEYTFQTCEFRTWLARVNYPQELDRLRGKKLLLTMWLRSNNRNPVSIFTQFYAGTSDNAFKIDGGYYTKIFLTPFWRKYTFSIKAPSYDLTRIDSLTSNALLKFYFDDKSENYDVDFGGMMVYEDNGKFGFTNFIE